MALTQYSGCEETPWTVWKGKIYDTMTPGDKPCGLVSNMGRAKVNSQSTFFLLIKKNFFISKVGGNSHVQAQKEILFLDVGRKNTGEPGCLKVVKGPGMEDDAVRRD